MGDEADVYFVKNSDYEIARYGWDDGSVFTTAEVGTSICVCRFILVFP